MGDHGIRFERQPPLQFVEGVRSFRLANLVVLLLTPAPQLPLVLPDRMGECWCDGGAGKHYAKSAAYHRLH